MTLGAAADAVILSVTGLNPSDDTNVDKEYVMYLLATTRDAFAKGYLDKSSAVGMPIDSSYILREWLYPSEVEEKDNVDAEDERLFVELTNPPLDIIGDRGVVEVTTDEKIPVLKAQMQNITMFRDLRFSKPTSENLVYYRHGKKIVIEGMSSKNVEEDLFIVDYVPALGATTLADATEMYVPDALVPGIMEQVTRMLADQLGIPMDAENDGTVAEPQPKK